MTDDADRMPTSRPQPSGYQQVNHGRPVRPPSDGPLIALGVMALVISVLGFLGWFFVGIGVAMCTDGRSAATCNHVSNLWDLTGYAVFITFAVGLTTTIAAKQRRTPIVRRVLGGATIAALLLLLVVACVLSTTASSV